MIIRGLHLYDITSRQDTCIWGFIFACVITYTYYMYMYVYTVLLSYHSDTDYSEIEKTSFR